MIQIKISKGKRCIGERAVASFQLSSPSGVTWTVFLRKLKRVAEKVEVIEMISSHTLTIFVSDTGRHFTLVASVTL